VKARFDAEGIETNYSVSTVCLRGERRGAAPHRVEHLPKAE
jgi:hypothetical protein